MALKPIALLSLILPLTLLLVTSRADEGRVAILDADGNPLQRGAQYLVLPTIFSNGGGLRMSRVNQTCPPHVIQWSLEVKNGQPVIFFPEERPTDGIVRVSDRIYVLIPRPSRCPQSTLWQVDGEGYVTTGGTVSLADPHRSRFSIYKSSFGHGYIIQSCPCRRCLMSCSNVVVTEVNGRRLLSVSLFGNPHEVVFVKVKEEATNILPATMLPDVDL